MRQLTFVLGLLLALLLIIACDNEPEEDIGNGGDEALTAAETFDEVLRTAASMQSVEIEWTREDADGEPYTTRQVLSPEGMYWKQDGGLDGFDEICAEAGAVIEPANVCDLDFGEMLLLGETDVYYRDRATREWVRADGTGDAVSQSDVEGATSFQATGSILIGNALAIQIPGLTRDGAARLARFLPFLSGTPVSIAPGQQVSSDERGLQSLVLRLAQDLPDPAEQLGKVPVGEDEALDDIADQIAAQIADSPVRTESDVTLVVGPDFRPNTGEAITRMYAADGRLLRSETVKYVYSLWNEAELPGPLPAR